MKQFTYLWFAFCIIVTLSSLAFYQYYFKQNHDPNSDKIAFCKNANRTRPHLNYHGPSLVSSSKDIVLCPGDTFGDLNNTYIEVKNCYLAMYRQDKMIWSSKMDQRQRGLMRDQEKVCAFSLQRDGNLVLYKEATIYANPGGKREVIFDLWDSQTHFHPARTELKVQGQQITIVQTFKDGTERLFYADEDNQEFKEKMGVPKKVADREIIINHSQEDKTILRRNEFMGDLNGTHLILQEDCQLQLRNKDHPLWSFIPSFRHEMNCALSIDGWKDSVILSTVKREPRDLGQEIITGERYLPIIQTKITFEGDQPIIIQTLKNGSELIFSSGPGQNIGLKPKKEPRQIAENTLNVPKNGSKDYIIERMDYIGNLSGLHLILEQNCSFMLLNTDQKLWEFHPAHDDTLMDCSIVFDRSGYILLKREWSGILGGGVHLLKTDYSRDITGYQLTLENDQLIITRQHTDRVPDVYHADSRTRGVLFQAITKSSVIINHDSEGDRVLPKKGYIGDLDGVYVIFEENCNWVLYNKTRVIWESGISLDDFFDQCELVLKGDGTVNISPGGYGDDLNKRPPVWSSLNLPIADNLEKKVLKTELRVSDDGLWLINTFDDGTLNRWRAMEGTHNFALQREKEQFALN